MIKKIFVILIIFVFIIKIDLAFAQKPGGNNTPTPLYGSDIDQPASTGVEGPAGTIGTTGADEKTVDILKILQKTTPEEVAKEFKYFGLTGIAGNILGKMVAWVIIAVINIFAFITNLTKGLLF